MLPHFLRDLPLPLLVLLVGTDHPHDAATADNLALVANLLDRCPDFHQLFLGILGACLRNGNTLRVGRLRRLKNAK
jgi:hypothetical protein